LQIRDILQAKQPEKFKELRKLSSKDPHIKAKKKKAKKNKANDNKANKNSKITERDILECMGHGAWRRGSGGSMRQVRW